MSKGTDSHQQTALSAQQRVAASSSHYSSSKKGCWHIIGYLVLVGLIFYFIIEKSDLHWCIALILAFLLGGIMFITEIYPIAIIYIIYKIIKEL